MRNGTNRAIVQKIKMMRASLCCLLLILATSCSQESAEKPPVATAAPTAAVSASPNAAATASATATSTPAAESHAYNRIPAKVTRVVDGDTMKVSYSEGGKVKEETIRLLLVDTPESVDPEKPVQPFAIEASNYAKQMLTNKDVQLELDVSERDKYGRLLCYLYIGDRMFNELLLENGYARVAYIYPPNVRYVDQFRGIQKKAQQKGLNIWSLENYAQEDGFHEGTAPVKASPAATATPAPKPAASTAPAAGVSYSSCAEAKAAGVYNIRRGEPGYSAKLDGDNDGVACEKK